MIVPEERRHWSKERRSNRSNYCQSDSHDRRRHNTAAAARHSSRRIGGHPDWHFRSSGTPCSPSSSEQDSSLDERPDEGPASPRGAKYLPRVASQYETTLYTRIVPPYFWPYAVTARAERRRSVWTHRRRRSPVFLARHQDGPVSITCRTTTGALPMPDRGHKRSFDSRLPTSDLPRSGPFQCSSACRKGAQ